MQPTCQPADRDVKVPVSAFFREKRKVRVPVIRTKNLLSRPFYRESTQQVFDAVTQIDIEEYLPRLITGLVGTKFRLFRAVLSAILQMLTKLITSTKLIVARGRLQMSTSIRQIQVFDSRNLVISVATL